LKPGSSLRVGKIKKRGIKGIGPRAFVGECVERAVRSVEEEAAVLALGREGGSEGGREGFVK
jgi:hypothetical protein